LATNFLLETTRRKRKRRRRREHDRMRVERLLDTTVSPG